MPSITTCVFCYWPSETRSAHIGHGAQPHSARMSVTKQDLVTAAKRITTNMWLCAPPDFIKQRARTPPLATTAICIVG
jgi:hypothetical protein